MKIVLNFGTLISVLCPVLCFSHARGTVLASPMLSVLFHALRVDVQLHENLKAESEDIENVARLTMIIRPA